MKNIMLETVHILKEEPENESMFNKSNDIINANDLTGQYKEHHFVENGTKVLLLDVQQHLEIGDPVKLTLNPNKFTATVVHGKVVDTEQINEKLDVLVAVTKA